MICPECGDDIGDAGIVYPTRKEQLALLKEHFQVCDSPRVKKIMTDNNDSVIKSSMDVDLGVLLDINRTMIKQAIYLKSLRTALWVIALIAIFWTIISFFLIYGSRY